MTLFTLTERVPYLRANLSLVGAAKYVISNKPLIPEFIDSVLHQSSPSSQKLTTAVLLKIGTQGTNGQVQAESWLQEAIKRASVEEQRFIGIRLEKQAERWALQGKTQKAHLAFGLVYSLGLPFPEPYFQMAQFRYDNAIDIGISRLEALQLAITAPASTLRDNAFKSMAHTRLCEYFSRTSNSEARDYELAVEHCQQAQRLASDAGGYLKSGYGSATYNLLKEAQAQQEQ